MDFTATPEQPKNTRIFTYDEMRKGRIALPTTAETGKLTAPADDGIYAVMSSDQVPALEDTKKHWSEKAVLELASLGVVTGDPSGQLPPGQQCDPGRVHQDAGRRFRHGAGSGHVGSQPLQGPAAGTGVGSPLSSPCKSHA